MKWSTEVAFQNPPNPVQKNDGLLFIGSCFSENIGRKLQLGGLNIQVNPFGVSYNIESIFKQINSLEKGFDPKDLRLFKYNGLWHSKDHHGSFSHLELPVLKSNIEKEYVYYQEARSKLKHVFITPGTSWKWVEKESGEIVNNCHKRPGKDFELIFIQPYETLENFKSLIRQFPLTHFWFSVSPVRHLKQGAEKNQRSKAGLLYSIHELVEKYSNVNYFPAYEIVMDELRDYRFYAQDMLHPNETAIQEIWGRFSNILADDSLEMIKSSEKVRNYLNHRILHKTPENEKAHLERGASMIEEWEKKWSRPFVY